MSSPPVAGPSEVEVQKIYPNPISASSQKLPLFRGRKFKIVEKKSLSVACDLSGDTDKNLAPMLLYQRSSSSPSSTPQKNMAAPITGRVIQVQNSDVGDSADDEPLQLLPPYQRLRSEID